MKTLIINGSPRKNGDTVSMINLFKDNFQGEVIIWDCCFRKVSHCVDCRYCRKNKGCRISDEWNELFDYIIESDNIVIASPVYFSQLTGMILSTLSRLQCIYCAEHFQNIELIPKKKKGGIILAGGGDGSCEPAERTAKILLHMMNCGEIYPAVKALNTNNVPAAEEKGVLEQLLKLQDFFIKSY
ncbi:MAG: flavodoxin family protein [Hominimerdicola sp.]